MNSVNNIIEIIFGTIFFLRYYYFSDTIRKLYLKGGYKKIIFFLNIINRLKIKYELNFK